ncbi:hypothetical protein RUM43_004197, partial [Polyplax serrata]
THTIVQKLTFANTQDVYKPGENDTGKVYVVCVQTKTRIPCLNVLALTPVSVIKFRIFKESPSNLSRISQYSNSTDIT